MRSEELVDELENQLVGSVVVSCCFEKLVAWAGDSPGTQRKTNDGVTSR
jgi:hypothetical protein